MLIQSIDKGKFYAIGDSDGTGGKDSTLTKDDILDALKDDDADDDILDDADDKKDKKDDVDDDDDVDDKKVKKDKKEDKDDTDDAEDDDKEDKDDDDEDDEEDDLELIEGDLEDPDDEKLELVTPVRRSEILKKYPKLFKEFPYLENAYYREQQFTEIFPHPRDAKEAKEANNALRGLEEDLAKGEIEKLFKSIHKNDPEAFNKIADNYLEVLGKVDKEIRNTVVGNALKGVIRTMWRSGVDSNDEDLKSAAAILNKFVFQSTSVEPDVKLSSKKDDKADAEGERVRKEREDWNRERFEASQTDLTEKVQNSIKATIMNHIDEKKDMTSYVRNNATRDAVELLNKNIDKDARFKVHIDKLWENAIKNKYSQTSIAEIRKAYLSKARTLLPAVIKKARIDALRGMGKRVHEDKSEKFDDDVKLSKGDKKRNSGDSDSSRRQRTSNIKDAKDIPKGMSTLDFLNAD